MNSNALSEYEVDVGETVKKLFKKDYSYKVILSIFEKKYKIFISITTLKRILSKNNLKRKNIVESSKEKLMIGLMFELEGSGFCFNLGYKAMWKRLKKKYNLIAKQKTILNILNEVDQEGIEARSRYRLKRRVYKVPGPNFLWHVDGHDKLKKFGFAIYGRIDGFSKKVST